MQKYNRQLVKLPQMIEALVLNTWRILMIDALFHTPPTFAALSAGAVDLRCLPMTR